ncbi:hypothetical protein L195_g040385, partial [Trifolium pratense]
RVYVLLVSSFCGMARRIFQGRSFPLPVERGTMFGEGIFPLEVIGLLVPRLIVEEMLRILHLMDAACYCGHVLWRLFQLPVIRACPQRRGDIYVGDSDESLEGRVVLLDGM